MLHLRKYDEFVNEGLMDFLKKTMRGLIDAFSEDTKKLAGNVSSQIEKLPEYKDAKPLLEKTFTERTKGFEAQKNYKSVRDFVKEDLMLVELFLTDLSQKFEPSVQGQSEEQRNLKKLKPNKFFEDSANGVIKKIFSYSKGEDFQGALNDNVKNLMLELGKKAGLQNPEEKFQDEQKNESKIYEAQDMGENLDADESFKKFKQTTSDFRINGLFKPILDKLDKVEIGGTKEGGEELQKIADAMKGSNNKETLNKMLQKFTTSEKDTLIAVRDALGFTKDDAPL
jgi:hypothetical protein